MPARRYKSWGYGVAPQTLALISTITIPRGVHSPLAPYRKLHHELQALSHRAAGPCALRQRRAHRLRDLPDGYVPFIPQLLSAGGSQTFLSGCNTVAVACYAAAGFTFGTLAAPLAPPAIIACNGALGTCSAACAVVALTPTP